MKQLTLFLTALRYYTRIPIPRSVKYQDELLARANTFFPFIGWIVGALGAAVFYGLSWILPHELSVLFSMITTVLLTGAFHEDGFADFCDGFGASSDKNKILEIIKDSRLGTYGALGLLGVLSAKFFTLSALPAMIVPFVLLAGHAFSRLMPLLIIFNSTYVGRSEISKSIQISRSVEISDLAIASVFAVIPVLLFQALFIIIVIPVSLVISFLFKTYIEKKIGGYTGDCLGALQQIIEVLFYVCLLIVS